MWSMRGSRWLTPAWVLLLLLAGTYSHTAIAQTARPPSTSTPTPEQIEAFRDLSPEQQRAVLDAASRSNSPGGQPVTDDPLQDPSVTTPGTLLQPALPPGPPRIAGDGTIVIKVTVDDTPDPNRAAVLRSRSDRIHAGNPYRLGSGGQLTLPFLPPIGMGGLTDEEAAQRLDADPRLDGMSFEVRLLPVEPFGTAALRPFGYDVFKDVPSTFAPATDIPVPADYAIGPGDRVIVNLSGKRGASYSLTVDREGRVHLPDLGPVQVAGLGFEEMREQIEGRVAAEMIGVRATVTMGPLRSIRVFVVGDVVRPGSYTISGLSTVTHALFISGGVSQVGSLRRLELKRGGATVRRLDLYDLLLRGDTANDARLQSGDVVFVPPIGATAGIAGRVNRPAIYEFDSGATVSDLVNLSGGLTPDADARVASLERIDGTGERTVLNFNLSSAEGRTLKLLPGDVLTVPQVLEELARSVTLEGEVQRPGRYAWRSGMRLTDLLVRLDALKINADQRYILIRRERLPERRVEVLSADATQAFASPASAANPELASRDRVLVFSMQRDRGVELGKLLDELRLQARDTDPPPIVSISGRVRAPGYYPLESGMTLADLIRAGGGLDEAAYRLDAELTRLDIVNGESRQTEVVPLKLSDLLSGGESDVALQPYDTLVVKQTPDWDTQGTIKILGEVRFPGEYPIRKGETLSTTVLRAGGLTGHAFQEGAVFTREEIKTQERSQIENLATRLQSDLALVALQSAQSTTTRENTGDALAVGQSLLTQLRATKPTGRLVISLGGALASKNSDQDLELRDGDTLVVPPRRQFVTVIGEANNPTSHVWRRGLGRDDYLSLSGGTTDKADAKRIYVVRADGSVVAERSGKWFSRSSADIRPGDTIVIPLDTNKMRPLPLWTAVTTIIYNLAVSVAAIGSI
jgi:polysaccharide biosynthesis/export protein